MPDRSSYLPLKFSNQEATDGQDFSRVVDLDHLDALDSLPDDIESDDARDFQSRESTSWRRGSIITLTVVASLAIAFLVSQALQSRQKLTSSAIAGPQAETLALEDTSSSSASSSSSQDPCTPKDPASLMLLPRAPVHGCLRLCQLQLDGCEENGGADIACYNSLSMAYRWKYNQISPFKFDCHVACTGCPSGHSCAAEDIDALKNHHYGVHHNATNRQNCTLYGCPDSYFAKPDPEDLLCMNTWCSPWDVETCCDRRQSCGAIGGYVCPGEKVLKFDPDHVYCEGANCTADDEDRCCEFRTTCDTYTCGLNRVPRNNPTAILCARGTCNSVDENTCCKLDGTCDEFFCPGDKVLKSNPHQIFCHGATCTTHDTDRCCAQRGTCGAFQCPPGKILKAGSDSIECKLDRCTETDDTDTCCDAKGTCDEFYCPMTKLLKSKPHKLLCLGAHCNSKDIDTCCKDRRSCEGFTCSVNLNLRTNPAAYLCKTDECLPDDEQTCCGNSSHCGGFHCPFGKIRRGNPVSLFCSSERCDSQDTDTCCEARETCENFQCPLSTILRDSPSTLFCRTAHCSDSDSCTCCEPRQSCDLYRCPAGMASKPNVSQLLCAGPSCNRGDMDTCCQAATTCEKYACPNDKVLRETPDQLFCNKAKCTTKDESTCCEPLGNCRGYECPISRALKPNPADYACKSARCNSLDIDACCEYQTSCAGYLCPYHKTLRAGAASLLCKQAICDTDDVYSCCEGEDNCVGFTCPAEKTLRANPDRLFCKATKCETTDTDTCCEAKDVPRTTATTTALPSFTIHGILQGYIALGPGSNAESAKLISAYLSCPNVTCSPEPAALVPRTYQFTASASSARYFLCSICNGIFKLTELEVRATSFGKVEVGTTASKYMAGYGGFNGNFGEEANKIYASMPSAAPCDECKVKDLTYSMKGAVEPPTVPPTTPAPTPAPIPLETLPPLPPMPGSTSTPLPTTTEQGCEHDCATCSSSTCVRCWNAKYLYGGKCVTDCPIGFFNFGATTEGRICKACATDCETCANSLTGEVECSMCSSGKMLYNNECLSSCPEGTYPTGSENDGFSCKASPGNSCVFYNCPSTMVRKADPANILCRQEQCTKEDALLCCDPVPGAPLYDPTQVAQNVAPAIPVVAPPEVVTVPTTGPVSPANPCAPTLAKK